MCVATCTYLSYLSRFELWLNVQVINGNRRDGQDVNYFSQKNALFFEVDKEEVGRDATNVIDAFVVRSGDDAVTSIRSWRDISWCVDQTCVRAAKGRALEPFIVYACSVAVQHPFYSNV